MWKFYVIVDERGQLSARFFETHDEAEAFLEENYYRCSGDILTVPLNGTGD
jgi:hypothetical protein